MAKLTSIGYQTAAAGGRGVESSNEAFGRADIFLDFQQQLARVAKVQRPVLLIGERGTGKELAASRVHFLSQRWGGPFIKLNCASLSPTVLESELFGHEVGAFTGAARRRVGRFEAAHGGTLFLDEIGQMPMPVQEKILRVVEYGSFERVGSSEAVEVDVRLVGATNVDLAALAEAGQFKHDLLDRLSFEVMYLPSLRQRGAGDIDLLAHHFAARMSVELGLPETPTWTAAAAKSLQTYDWPGNVRELKNVVERAVSRSEGGVVKDVIFDPFRPPAGFRTTPPPSASTRPGTIPPATATSTAPTQLPVSLPDLVSDLEQRLLVQALAQTRFRQREAATLLGLSYDQFRGLYRKHQPRLQNPSEPAA